MTTTPHATTPTRHGRSPAAESTSPAGDGPASSRNGFPVVQATLFVAGCLLLILAAANLSHLSEWSQRWGQIPVFLGFFLVMSIAGRWFWTGADAILAKTIGNR